MLNNPGGRRPVRGDHQHARQQGQLADRLADGHLPEEQGARAGAETQEHREPGRHSTAS